MCMFCRSLFVLFSFFTWPLCCLFFFDLRILITPLVSWNYSYRIPFIQTTFEWRHCIGMWEKYQNKQRRRSYFLLFVQFVLSIIINFIIWVLGCVFNVIIIIIIKLSTYIVCWYHTLYHVPSLARTDHTTISSYHDS